jgi:hypothetical protein
VGDAPVKEKKKGPSICKTEARPRPENCTLRSCLRSIGEGLVAQSRACFAPWRMPFVYHFCRNVFPSISNPDTRTQSPDSKICTQQVQQRCDFHNHTSRVLASLTPSISKAHPIPKRSQRTPHYQYQHQRQEVTSATRRKATGIPQRYQTHPTGKGL